MAHVFISYSHKDKAYARKLTHELERQGIEAWIDDRIDYGSQWPRVIQENLDACPGFVVIMSSNSYNSDWVQNEVSYAQDEKKAMFPILLEGKRWVSFAAKQYADTRNGELPPNSYFSTIKKQLGIKTARGQLQQLPKEKGINEHKKPQVSKSATSGGYSAPLSSINKVAKQPGKEEDYLYRAFEKRREAVSGTGSARIFISYRRSDSADIAGRIYERLTEKFGARAIIKDMVSIPLGTNFTEYLDEMVRGCKVMLVIIGDHWLDINDSTGRKRLEDPSDFVRIEIESALARNIPVIPIFVRGAQMPNDENLPSSLRSLVYRNGIPIRPDPDFHRDMDRLIKALDVYVK